MSNKIYFAAGNSIYTTSDTTFSDVSAVYTGTVPINSMRYDFGRYIICTTTGARTSTDLVNWTTIATFSGSNAYTNITYKNGRWFIHNGNNGQPGQYLTSTDGVTWVYAGDVNYGYFAFEYFKGYFYAGKNGPSPYSGLLLRSLDGINWTSIASYDSAIKSNPFSITTDGSYIAIAADQNSGSTNNNGGYSTDGVNWTALQYGPSSQRKNYKYMGNLWVATSEFGDYHIYYSNIVNATYPTILNPTNTLYVPIGQASFINGKWLFVEKSTNATCRIFVTANSNIASPITTYTTYNPGIWSITGVINPSIYGYEEVFKIDAPVIGSAPVITGVYGAVNGLKIYFTPPSGGYPSPSAYYYTVSGDVYDGSAYYLANGTSSPLTITGLNTVTSYTVKLMAYNSAGNTALSSPATGTPYIVPAGGPTITQITISPSNQLTVSFTPPAGSYYPTNLTYRYSLDGGNSVSSGSSTSPIVVPGLSVNKIYAVVLTAVASDASGNAWTSPPSDPFSIPCFLQGTKILRFNISDCKEEYVPVETLREGDLIKTSQSGYRAIHVIGHRTIYNPPLVVDTPNRIYCYKRGSKCPELMEDLYVTGNHCALLYDVPEETLEKVREHMGKIYVTEGDYRVPACLDDRATPLDKEGEMTIWHFALENECIYSNYGVYANGLLVESSSIRYMKEYSGM